MGLKPNKQVREAALLIRVSKRTIYRWLQTTTIEELLTKLEKIGPLLKPQEVALQINVSKSTIYRWAAGYSTVILPCCIFPGETVRFRQQDVEAFIKKQKENQTNDPRKTTQPISKN